MEEAIIGCMIGNVAGTFYVGPHLRAGPRADVDLNEYSLYVRQRPNCFIKTLY